MSAEIPMQKSKYMAARSSIAGFGLVEVMVALVLGLILIAGVLQIFIANRQSFATNEALGKVQENGRFALSFMTREIRLAGFSGCGNLARKELLDIRNNPNGTAISAGDALLGYEDGAGWTNPVDATYPLKAGTDVIVVRYMQPAVLPLTDTYKPTNANFKTNGNSIRLKKDESVIVTNCGSGVILKITNNPQQVDPGTEVTFSHGNNNVSRMDFAPGSSVSRYKDVTFFVTSAASCPDCLVKYDATSGQATPLVDGVEALEITYGEDTTGDRVVDVYNPANAVGDWGNVVAVRIGLLVHSDRPAFPDVEERPAYVVNGTNIEIQEVNNSDRLLRQVFTTTIALRNRLP